MIGIRNHPIQINNFQDAMLNVMCQPNLQFKCINPSHIQAKQVANNWYYRCQVQQSSSIDKNMVETLEKGNIMFIGSLDKVCMTNLEIEEKQLEYYKQRDYETNFT
jgi:hypothetical protein